jgi:YesN/AraC family two-component response regulator
VNFENFGTNEIGIYYRETPDYTAAGTHYHNVNQIIFVTDGIVRIKIDGRRYTVSKNVIVFISNLEKHSVYIEEAPYKRYVVSLSQKFSQLMLQDSPLLSILMQRPESFSHAIPVNIETAASMTQVLDSMVSEAAHQKAFWALRLSSLVIELLIQLYRYSSVAFPVNAMDNAVRIVTETQKYIIEHARDDISLEQLADRHFISKYHLSRIFKRITGYTFRDYLTLHRLYIAKDLLVHTDNSVSDVSQLSGYRNVNHFIRIFKAREGIPPHQYRKAQQGR